jgi:hypothetical protein
MSSSSSSPKNTTTTTDQRTTNTLNAGLGGDVEGLVAAGNYGETSIGLTSLTDNSDRSFVDNADNSFRVDQTDNSDNSLNFADYSDRSFYDNADNSFRVDMYDSSEQSYSDSSVSTLSDYSDNSLTVAMTDNTGSTNSGNSNFSNSESYSSSTTHNTNTNTNITDGGAFSIVNNLVGKVLDSQKSMIDLVGLSSSKALQSANDLAQRGIDGAMNIKAGEQVSMNDNKTKTEIAKTVLQVAAVGGAVYVGSRMLKR